MNRNLVLLVVIAVLASCNNTPTTQEPVVTAAPAKKDTIAATDTVIIGDVFTLSPAEMPDDSVFADGSQPVPWANAGIEHPIAFKQFLKQLQYWVVNDQKDSIAAVMAFPLKHPRIKDKAAFLKKYDNYFNEKVKLALAQQNLRQIFRSSQGAMIGDGQLWFSENASRFSIISINY